MYLLSIDQGTTSSRCLIFDDSGNTIVSAQKEFRQYFPKPGWVEHDPLEILSSVVETLQECLGKSGIPASEISVAGITNQRETTVIWDRQTGNPVYNAIVWQSRQSIGICERWKKQGLEEKVASKTGLVIDAYFSASKIAWIMENVDGAKERAVKGELAFGTIDTWLLWKLTKGKAHATDCSNASRTMIFNIHSNEWDKELLQAFEIPGQLLPEVRDSASGFGMIDKDFFGVEIPVTGILGDQQAALLGQACIEPGMSKNTYGTGCFMLMNTGKKAVRSSHGLITTVAWRINNEISYALEGSVFVAGSAVQWLRDGIGLFEHASETENLALSVETTDGVYFVPAFTGIGAPHWDSEARGSFFGLTRGTTKAHIIRAALEAMAYQTKDVFAAMETDSGLGLLKLRVDGGASANNFMMQFQSDMLRVEVDRPVITESTALGAALIAGLGAGIWPDLESCARIRIPEKTFKPIMDAGKAASLYNGWQRAVDATIFFSENR